MRRWLLAAMLGLMLSGSTGCAIPIFSGDPVRRTQQLLYVSENLRALQDASDRFWFLDMPDPMVPVRVHGGIL